MPALFASLTTLDLLFLGALLLSVLMGAWRGLVQEVMSLMGWIAALAAAYTWATPLSLRIPQQGLSDAPHYGLAFILIFVFALIGCAVVTAVLKKIIGAVGLSSFDRLLGATFGLIRGLVILISVTQLIGYTPIHDSEAWKTSSAVQAVQALAGSLKPFLPSSMGLLAPAVTLPTSTP